MFVMDLKKCRTCFTDLESNDLYLKLNVIHKNSTLSLAEKLKVCVPTMKLKCAEKLYICMQCSMHLETAFNFHTTCLRAEEQLQEFLSNTSIVADDTPNLQKGSAKHKKKNEMFCHTCNVSFVTKNIFDLHMKVMHSKEDVLNEVSVDLESKKSESKRRVRTSELARLGCDITSRPKRRAVEIKCNSTESKSGQIDNLKRRLKRSSNGTFIKNPNKTDFAKGGVVQDHRQKRTESNTVSSDTNKKTNKQAVSKTNVLESNLVKAEKAVENSSVHICKFCDRTFTAFPNLTRHLGTIHRNKCSFCIICQRHYTNSKEHTQKYGCQLQNSSVLEEIKYSFSDDLRLCYISVGSKQIMCIICRKICPTQMALKDHILANHKQAYKCKICRRKLSGLSYCFHIGVGCDRSLRTPFFNYTTDGDCICPLCDKIYPNTTQLTMHLGSTHSQDDLKCDCCKRRYSKLAVFCKHLVKGCDKKGKQKNEKTTSVEIEQECSKPVKACLITKEDPLETDNCLINKQANDEVNEDIGGMEDLNSGEIACDRNNLNRSVKIEPTELLDQHGFISNDNSNDNGDGILRNLSREYLRIDQDIVDSPDLVYVLADDKSMNK